jgi:hypothetical protein
MPLTLHRKAIRPTPWPKDFDPQNELNRMPGTDRLLSRRMGMPEIAKTAHALH